MTEFTRLTVIGSARKADLVVPNDEAVAGLMPRLMDLLDEPTGSVVRPLTLVRSTGEQLDVALTIADQEVSDGELLRLVRSDDAPPPPEVADVTDVLGETLRDRSGLWSTFTRELTGAIAIGVLGCALAGQLSAGPLPLVLAVLLLSGRRDRRPPLDALDLRGTHLSGARGGRRSGLDVHLDTGSLPSAAALSRNSRVRCARLDLSRSRLRTGAAFPAGVVRQPGRRTGLHAAVDHGAAGLAV